MARPLRLEFPGAVYHITARGNAQQAIFLDDEDRDRFLDLLAREIRQSGWKCYAYCLMNNHYHLLIETPEGNLVSGMRRLNGVYTQAFNRRHHRAGHLFQGRYKSIVVDRENYLLELCRYVALNPVRAKMVEKIEEWPWGSYRATSGLGKAPDWLDTAWVLSQFGSTRSTAQAAYRQFVAEGIGAAAPWENLRGQIWLGTKAFLEQMEKLISRHSLSNVPLEQAQPTRPRKEEIIRMVCKVYGVGEQKILGRSHPEAYQAAVYLLRRVANLSLKEVAGIFRISPSRISHIQHQIEAKDPDSRLQRLFRLYKVKN